MGSVTQEQQAIGFEMGDPIQPMLNQFNDIIMEVLADSEVTSLRNEALQVRLI